MLFDTSIQIFPRRGDPVRGEITASCSSLASMLAIGCLGLLTPRVARSRRAFALGVALAAVFLGNVVRITASMALGYVAGRQALVLFHDSIGSMFTFGYTLGGFILMLWLLLPTHPAVPAAPKASTHAR